MTKQTAPEVPRADLIARLRRHGDEWLVQIGRDPLFIEAADALTAEKNRADFAEHQRDKAWKALAEVSGRELDEARAAIGGVLKLHKAVGFDIDDDGTLDPDHDCCDYCSERDGEAVIYPCETVRALDGAIKPDGALK